MIAIENAKKRIYADEASVILIKEDKVIYEIKGSGIAPLLKIAQTDRNLLCGATVVDKIVGKAAASLFTLCGAAEVYALTLSRAGKEYLEDHGIAVSCDTFTEMIVNRQKTGMCPFEQAVKDAGEPEECFAIIEETLERLIKNADKPA